MEPLQPLPRGKRLTMTEVQALLGDIGETTLRRMMADRSFPPGVKIGGTPYWYEADVIAYEHLAMRGTFDRNDDEAAEEPQPAPRRPKQPPTPPDGTK